MTAQTDTSPRPPTTANLRRPSLTVSNHSSGLSPRRTRKLRVAASHVPLDDLLGWSATADLPRENRTRELAKGVVATTLMGLLLALLTVPFVGAAAITLREANDYWEAMPSALPEQPLPQRSVMLAADGTTIAEFYSENRVPVALKQVPKILRTAVVAIEDSRFYDHHGVDFRGIARALLNNALGGSTQGASTLTQQYVKNVLLNAADTDKVKQEVTSRTSYLRKLREAKLAIELERHMNKSQILTKYLNIAYFGDGAYGIGTAARHYFNKRVENLNLPEAALLAGLVKNPTGYDPTNNKPAARERRNVVLARMYDLDKITYRQYDTARRSPVTLHIRDARNGCVGSRYPFYCQWVKQQLEDDPIFGKTPAARNARLFRGGMTIHTTLDPHAQDLAQHAVDTALGRTNRVAAASVTVEPGTGNVIAMATNRGFGRGHGKTELILPVLPAFQPGSNFKPFTLAAALERGYDLSTVYDAPPVYAPANMNYPSTGFTNSGSYENGPLTAPQALWRSSNTFFVHLEEQVGVLNVANMATRLGITSLPTSGPRAITPRDASLTLGTYEVSPLEMAGAYATFAAHGIHCTPVAITSITDADDQPVAIPDADCHEAIPAGVADTMAQVMKGTIDGPDPNRTGKDMTIGRPAAGKTGTTETNAAVWFSGFTPQYATSVWVGDPRGGFKYPLVGFYAYGHYISRAYGYLVAGPIWRDVMLGLHANLPVEDFTTPSPFIGFTNLTPDVRGLTLPQAIQVLTGAGFDVTLSRKTAEDDPLLKRNRVYATTPSAGALVGYGTTVDITMTAGSDPNIRIAVPPPTDDTTTTAGRQPGQPHVSPSTR